MARAAKVKSTRSRPYVKERQSEYWTSRQIEEALLDAGYDVDVYPIDQRTEKLLPADFVFDSTFKIFGLQYKALYQGRPDYWPISPNQHSAMKNFPWIMYCLSDLRHRENRRRALHLARFYRLNRVTPPKHFDDVGGGYMRWGMFLRQLEQCNVGMVLESPDAAPVTLQDLSAGPLEYNIALDVFGIDLGRKKCVKMSSFLNPGLWTD